MPARLCWNSGMRRWRKQNHIDRGPLQTRKGSRIVGTTIYVVEYHIQNVKDFNVRPKYSNSMENATYCRDEYQEVASEMWGCRGTRAGARQHNKQQFVVVIFRNSA
jgi:hypothetical protein